MTTPPLKCTYCGGLLTDKPSLRRPCTAWWLAVGERLEDVTQDSYENIEVLGHGGMGAVFKATHRVFRYTQALKALAPDPEALHAMVPELVYPNEVLIQRFKTEATVMHRMSHENIVRVHEIAAKRYIHYFSMDYVDGPTLAAVIDKGRQEGVVGLDLVRVVLRDVGAALDYAHRQAKPVIHRDIKPSNVLIHPEGKALVTDFGIASVVEGTAHHTGSFVGTVHYMSPEAWRGMGGTAAADQYSFGVLAYELLTGRHPFTGTMDELQEAHRNAIPSPISEWRDDCPADLEHAVHRMLAKSPEQRWPTVADALDAMGVLDFPGIQAAREALGKVRGPSAAGPETATRLEIVGDRGPEVHPGDSLILSAVMVRTTGHQASRSQPGFVGWSSSNPDVAPVDDQGRVTARTPGSAVIRARSVGFNAEFAVTVLAPTTAPKAQVTLEIRGLPKALMAGDQASLTVEVAGLGADPSTVVVGWTSADPEVATVSNSGIVTAKRQGATRVIARAAGLTAEAQVEVIRAPTHRIEIEDPGRLTAGRTYRLRATAYDAQEQPVPDPGFRWSGSDRRVAEIDLSGTLQARLAGNARITVGADQSSASVDVEIHEPTVSRIEIAGWSDRRCRVGRTVVLSATKFDELGAPIAGPVRWSSSDPSVATIDDEGRLSFLAKGTAEIQASDDPITETRVVEVREQRRLSPMSRGGLWLAAGAAAAAALGFGGLASRPLVVQPAQVTFRPGDSVRVRASVRWWGALSVPVGVRFQHRGTGIVHLAESGFLKATGVGVDTFRVVRGSDTVLIVARVESEGRAPSSAALAIGPDSLAIGVGDSRPAGLVSAADSLGRPAEGEVRWTSRDPRIAGVDRSGMVVGRLAGRTVVIARLSALEDSVAVIVRATAPGSKITLAIVGADGPLRLGEGRTLKVQGRNGAGAIVAQGAVVWSSRNPAIVEVDPVAGRVVAKTAGRAVIVARVGDQETTVDVLAVDPGRTPPCAAGQLKRIGARPADTTLRQSETMQVTVDGIDDCGKPMPVGVGRWVVSPTGVVAVDDGLARALGPGTATVTLEVGDLRTSVRIAVEAPRGPSDLDRRAAIAGRDACAEAVRAGNVGGVAANEDRQWLVGVLRRGESKPEFTTLEAGDPTFTNMDTGESRFVLQLRFRSFVGDRETWRLGFVVKHIRVGGVWEATCQFASRAKS